MFIFLKEKYRRKSFGDWFVTSVFKNSLRYWWNETRTGYLGRKRLEMFLILCFGSIHLSIISFIRFLRSNHFIEGNVSKKLYSSNITRDFKTKLKWVSVFICICIFFGTLLPPALISIESIVENVVSEHLC